MRLNELPPNNFLTGSSKSSNLDINNQQLKKIEQTIKLSVITQFFPPDFAATGQLVEELVTQLGYLGVEVEVFTSQPGYAFNVSSAPYFEKIDSVRIKRSRSSQIWPGRIRGKAVNGILYTLRAVIHLLKNTYRSNVLLVTTAPPFLPVVGYLAKVWLGKSYVCILYDLYPDIAVALDVIDQDHWLAKLWLQFNKLVWRQAEGIVVLSQTMKERVAGICPDIADKISVIHSWADPDAIVPISKQENWFALKHKLVKKFTVLYSGNMGRCHDIDTILEAIKLLRDEPIQFVFIGGGAKRKKVQEELYNLGLDNVVFLPYQDKENLPYSMTACDLSLVSVDAGFESLVAPSKLYPALATARPIAAVCPPTSYLRQVIADAKCGATFVNGDSSGLAEFIRQLSQDQQLAEGMGNDGRRYLQSHFTPEIISKQYLEVLSQAIKL
ncbi:MAG: glycosyltransferase family 4 protein [Calothrix sp. C42_A2020_038]|nr:glycosyltransferase family 4 protein [Calothrix sp. C42_A2020_038]